MVPCPALTLGKPPTLPPPCTSSLGTQSTSQGQGGPFQAAPLPRAHQCVDTCLPVFGPGPPSLLMYQNRDSISRGAGQIWDGYFRISTHGVSAGAVGQSTLTPPACGDGPASTRECQSLVPGFLMLGVSDSIAEKLRMLNYLPSLFVFL